jgi:hypothetical protein
MCQQAVATDRDVLARELACANGIAGEDSVEDALVLLVDIINAEQMRGLHLTDAEFDFAHDERVHAGQPRVGLASDERPVERDVLVGEVCAGLDESAMGRQCGGRDTFEPCDGSGLDDRTTLIEISDLHLGELGHPRSLVRLTAQQPLGDKALDGHLCRLAGDAKPSSDNGFGHRRTGRDILRDDARPQALIDRLREHAGVALSSHQTFSPCSD